MSTVSADAAGPVPTPRTGFIAWFAGNRAAANLLMLFLIVGGVLTGLHLAVQNFPELDTRTVTVTVRSPGSSAKEVEEDVNRRVEEAVVGLSGVARVVSTATQGRGRIEVEVAEFAEAADVLNAVEGAVDAIERFPPLNAERPEVELWQVALEVMTLAVSSSLVAENDLRLAAEELRDGLLTLPSVSQVSLEGTRDREISIELSEEELLRHDLSLRQVVNAVQRASLNLTFGELRTQAGSVVLHTVSKRRTGSEFADIPLITRLDGTIVTVGDVARIRDGFVDEDIVSEFNGRPAVFVRVAAAKGQSVVDIADEIRRWLATWEAPRDVDVSVWNDRATPVFERFSRILRNALIGTVLVFLTLVLVFDLRVSFWVTLGIPLSFVGSLLLFGTADLTLNMGTLFAFFLLIGIVVDDAVVVGESIAAEREGGKNALAAAIAGAKAVVGPLTVGVATTVIAFLPLLYVTAGYYQVVAVFPWVALFVLLVSLVEAFFILPAHLSHARPWSAPPLSTLQDRARERLDDVRDRIVVPAVSWAVRHVWSTLVLAVAVVIVSLFLIRSETVRIVVFDRDLNAPDSIQADLRLPVGTPFEVTLAAAERFASAARAINDELDGTSINGVSILAGNLAGPSPINESRNAGHLASVRVHLNPRPERIAAPVDIERTWRRLAGVVPEAGSVAYRTTRVKFPPSVAYTVQHDRPDILERAVAEFRSLLAAMPGIHGISDDRSLGKRHFEIALTPAGKAAGLTPAGIGAQLRANFHGVEVQRIQRGREEVKVMVRYPPERRRSLRELAGERIRRPGGGEVPLSTVARLTEKRGLATRTRIDGRQASRISANADVAVITPIQARREVERSLIPGLLAKYPGIRIEPDGGARKERAMLETLGLLVPLALLAMYALMAAFLRSYWKPIVSVAGVPIAFAGAVLGHWVLGWDFTAMSLFGVIGVAGVVVNDSLVLLDRYNTIRRENAMIPAIAAAAAATRHRFRAVFLTSLTTVLGLSPMLYDRSDELIIFVPLVVSMLGGLALATLFTLFLLPALVMMVEGRRD